MTAGGDDLVGIGDQDDVVSIEQLLLERRERFGHPGVIDARVGSGDPDEAVPIRRAVAGVVVEHVDVVGREKPRVVAQPERQEHGLVVDDRDHCPTTARAAPGQPFARGRGGRAVTQRPRLAPGREELLVRMLGVEMDLGRLDGGSARAAHRIP